LLFFTTTCPPIQASNLNSSIASNKVVVCKLFLLEYFPFLQQPFLRHQSCTLRTINSNPNSFLPSYL
jgi:hypothetical protein